MRAREPSACDGLSANKRMSRLTCLRVTARSNRNGNRQPYSHTDVQTRANPSNISQYSTGSCRVRADYSGGMCAHYLGLTDAELERLVDELTMQCQRSRARVGADDEFAGVGVEAYPKSVVPIIVPEIRHSRGRTGTGAGESGDGTGAVGIRAAVDTAARVQYTHRERRQADVACADGTRPLCDRLPLVL